MTDNTTKSSRKYDPLKPRPDVHEAFTAKIVAAIEAGAGEFQMPWHRPGVAFTIPKNAVTGNDYRGSNILSLWIDAAEKKFEHQVWATYKQYEAIGAQVRKGEKGSLIVKYGQWTPKDAKQTEPSPSDAVGDGDDPKRMFAKAAWVFNVDQVDMPAEQRATLLPATTPRRDLTERLAHVDAFIAATGAEFREGGQRAFYRHRASDGSGDFIQMPPRELFTGTATSTPTESYESTRLHELGHWGHAAHRLGFDTGSRFGSNTYAFFELVAEIGAAFLCAELEIANTPRLDHAQYCSHWLEILKGDRKAIFSAAALATRIVDYLIGLQPGEAPDPRSGPGETASQRTSAADGPEGPS
jgi:antirestriction protein ArdC